MSRGAAPEATQAAMVIDCSVTMAWCFEDEATPSTSELLLRLERAEALVPSLWYFEVANVLGMAERRGRISRARVTAFIELLAELPIVVVGEASERALGPVLELCREERLSAYDAAYLDVAMRRDVPLATLDADLRAAALRLGVALLVQVA